MTRNAGGEAESIPGFQRALELDPNFAMAHGRMSAIYTNLGEDDKSLDEAKKAFDLRDRVSERERFYIDDHFYSAIGDVEKNKEVLELATRAYPNDSSAFGNLALEYNLFLWPVRQGNSNRQRMYPAGARCSLWLFPHRRALYGDEPFRGSAFAGPACGAEQSRQYVYSPVAF